MSYNRQPNIILAGKGLTQNPLAGTISPPGIIPVTTLDTDIATTTSLGIVQVGSGLSITPEGILSTIGINSLINVTLINDNYIATFDDYYIGATTKNIIITLPIGIVKKVYIVKNQVGEGSIKVQGSANQTLDSSIFKTLGTEASLIVIFDGFRWNLI